MARLPSRSDQTHSERLDRLEQLHSDFLAMVAHEIRDPLTSCIGYAELLLGRQDDMTREEQREALETISKTGRRLVSLIEDILEVMRLEGGTLPHVTQPVDLNDVVRGVLDEQRPLLGDVRVELEPGDDAVVEGDASRLHQVVANLVSNAAKFSSSDGVVRIAARHEGDEVVLSVRDEGIGIDPEELPRLFGRFERITQPGPQERVPGTGLGLYIAKSIVDAHGGRIWAESEPGRGSTFSVAFRAVST